MQSMRGKQKIILKSNGNVFYNQLVELGRFRKVARQKFNRAELRVVEYMRFKHNGRGNIQLFAYIRKIAEKGRIYEFFVPFVSNLLYYFFAY